MIATAFPGYEGQHMATRLVPMVLSALLYLAASSAQAQQEPKRTPIGEFQSAATYGLLSCSIEARGALAAVELREQDSVFATLDPCIDKAKAAAKKQFQPALSKVAKKPEAAKLLKDYYAAWISAMDAIRPKAEETMRQYQTRRSAASQRADEIWNRFEIEAGL